MSQLHITQQRACDFATWVRATIVPMLRSEQAARVAPKLSWPQLKLRLINWADEQCNLLLSSGAEECFADLSQLLDEFLKDWKRHELDFFQMLPDASKWEAAQLDYLPRCLFSLLIDELTEEPESNQALLVYDRQRIRSSAFELAHYFVNLRQRLSANDVTLNQPRLTHMLKVHSQQRYRPKRDVPFLAAIRDYLSEIRYRELAHGDWAAIQQEEGREWILDVWQRFLSRVDRKEIAPFQMNCFRTLLDSALLKDGRATDPVIITAGTGYGKTEAFLFPILFYATINLLRQKHQLYGPDAILLYPRIDLCNNQLERYLWYSYNLRQAVLDSPRTKDASVFISNDIFRAVLGHSGARPDVDSEPFQIQCPVCRSTGQEGFIRLRANAQGFGNTPYCTTDEINHDVRHLLLPHLTTQCGRFTVAIATVDTIHRRLMDLHGRSTLWKKSSYLPRFIVLDEIHVYDGQTGSHVANLARRLKVYLGGILENNKRKSNPLPPLFIGASATIGNPEEICSTIFGAPRENISDRILKPGIDESEPLGREYIFLLKTPPLREVQDSRNGSPRSRVVPEQASLLQGLMAFWHGMRKTPNKYRLLVFADSIDSVWRITRNLDDAEGSPQKNLFSFRTPRGRWPREAIVNGNHHCPKFCAGQICSAPPHQFFDGCGIYQAGECWWSMGSSTASFLRPMRIVGKISGFTRSAPNFPDKNVRNWDCMIATSTLEVGFDHEELIATAQFKAPPNPASFQQRKGRGGRGVDDTPMTLVVLGNTPGDLFAFKHEQRFFNPTEHDLRIEFDPNNQFIRHQHALSAVYDFMSWRGILDRSPDIHKKCDIKSALNFLTEYRAELDNWIVDLCRGDGFDRNAGIKLAQQCIDQMQNAVINLNQRIPGVDDSLGLFLKTHIPPEIKVGIKARITNGIAAPDDSKTLAVLEEAERWTKPYLHPADYFNRLPVDNHGIERDSSWVIPGTFIPTPIGGFVSVLGTGVAEISETEPKLQTLSNFLPGGFKHRWGFRLWYGRWQSVPDRPAFADATELTQESEHLGTLEEILAGRPLPPPLKDFPPNSTLLINPRVLRVEAGQEHFHLTANRLRVKNANDPPGGVALSREPSSTAQTFDLIVSNEDGTAIEIADRQMGVEGVTFGENKLLRLFYSNLVNCYPKSIGNVAQPPLSINVKFFDRLTNQRTIPAVAMRTQGIHLHGTILPKDVDKLLSACEGKTRNEHYWRLVYRLLWREAFLNRSLTSFRISFAFDCIKVVSTLRFLEFHCRLTNQGTDLGSLSATDFERMFKQSSDVCEDLGLDIFKGSTSVDALRQAVNWQDLKDSVLLRAEDELRTAISESYVKSLAMAVCRDVAELTNTNMDLIQTSLEIAPGSDDRIHFRTCVYDNLEGGGGTTLSYCERVKRRMHLIDISRNAMLCGTSRDENSILDILTNDKFNADSLYALVRSCHDLREFGLTEVASFKLRRLLSSPSITAFYQGVAEGYAKLRTVIDREPGEEELACFINLRPIADIRGNDLFMQFKRRRGGVSELIPRIAEIMRICHGSCPDCLGDSRLSFEKGEEVIADRNLLGEVAC